MTYDPDLHGPPEQDHDDDPGADDELWAEAAAEQARWQAEAEASDD